MRLFNDQKNDSVVFYDIISVNSIIVLSLEYKLYSKLNADFKLSVRNIELEHRLLEKHEHSPIILSKLDDLIDNYASISKYLPYQFDCHPIKFESILKKIHLNVLSNKLVENILIIKLFLLCGYLNTNDIRYFNELLKLTSLDNEDCFLIAVKRFQKNTRKKEYHIYPFSTKIGSLDVKEEETIIPELNINKIGLLGHPLGFNKLKKKLHRLGLNTSCIHIPSFNPGAKDSAYKINIVKRLVMFSSIGIALSKAIGLIPKDCKVLKYKKEDPKLGEEIKKEKLDLSLHRLYGIIKKNIIENSGFGIINDHVGYLPYFRGMSTIDYSVLHGLPIAATVHIIDEGIDTGIILKTFFYKPIKGMTFNDIESAILYKSQDRLIEVIKMLRAKKIQPKINQSNLGRQYYNLHPSLSLYVKSLCKRQILNLDYDGIDLYS